MPSAPQQHKPKSIGKAHTKPRHHSASDKRRGTAHGRGYSARWARFSQSFKRANPLCEYCLAKGRVEAATVTDHDLPHGGDPELFWNNTFTALCAACHNGPKARAEARLNGDDLLAWVSRQKGQ